MFIDLLQLEGLEGGSKFLIRNHSQIEHSQNATPHMPLHVEIYGENFNQT